jgi:cell division protein FtsL
MTVSEHHARVYPVWLPDRPPRRARVRRRRLSPIAGAMVMAVLCTLPALFLVAQRVQRAETGYAILRLQREIAQLRADHARLSAQVSALRAPQRIERIATTELGMVPPRQPQLAAITIGPATARVEVSGAPGTLHRLVRIFTDREAEARERRR